MAYEQAITRQNKTLFVFIVDQSGSMSETWSTKETKSEKVAEIINKTIDGLITACDKGDEEIRNYYDIAVIGYGDSAETIFNSLTFVGKKYKSVCEIEKDIRPAESGIRQVILANHDKGETNTAEAFRVAHDIVQEWVDANKDSFPPTVFHITDGQYTTGNPLPEINRLKALGTNDGKVLLWNMHIATIQANNESVDLPKDENDVKNKITDGGIRPYAIEYFHFSSEIPQSDRFNKELHGKKMYIFNGNARQLEHCMTIGTQ